MGKVDYEKICTDCGAHCCKIGGPLASREEVEAVINAGHTNHFMELGEFFVVRPVAENGPCPYLDEKNRCTIYEVRPVVCRTWPDIVVIKDGRREYLRGKECPLAEHLAEEDSEKSRVRLKVLSPRQIEAMETWSNICGYKAR